MSKSLKILFGIAVLFVVVSAILNMTDVGTTLFDGGKATWMLPLVTVTALVDSINPCAFSVLILTIAFLFSTGKSRKEIIKIGGVYITGIYLAYILIGLGILQVLSFFGVPHVASKFGAGLLIVVGGLSMINEYFPKFPIKLKLPNASHGIIARYMEKASIPAALILGIIVGGFEFPCTGGPYLMIIGLLHDSATFIQGFLYLIYYNLLFIAPLVIILAIASDKTLLAKAQAWKKTNNNGMRLWGGLVMLLLGGLMLLL
jgi:cytochrome c biogenesis protein CcdA